MRSASLLLLLGMACASFAQADTPKAVPGNDRALMGGINFEDSGPKVNTYTETQDAAIDYFHKLAAVTVQLAQGATTGEVPALTDNMLAYLNAVYLYCAVNFGECPMMLDAILEADVVNSRILKQAQCPNMTRFWKTWVKSDMEARHKYLVKTSFLKVTSDFNQQKRPAYIKCQENVAVIIGPKESDAIFFKKRYSPDSAFNLVAAKAAKLLEDVKVKIPNIFGAVGSTFAASERAPSNMGQTKVRR